MCNHSPSPASFLLPFVVASDSSSAPTVEHPPRVTIKQLLHSQLATGRQREAPQVDTAALHQAMSDLLKDTWADSTWARRRSLYQQYLEFQLQRGLPPLLEHQAIIEFVVAKSLDGSISMRTAAQYMRELRALMTAMNDDPIKLATRAMMRRGATTIEEAALPFPKATFYALLMTLPPDPRIPLFLAWKTASRWGDMVQLVKEDLPNPSAEEIVIAFRNKTKTSALQPFRSDLTAVVHHKESMSDVAHYLHALKKGQLLTTFSTSKMATLLATVRPPTNWTSQHPDASDHFTAHSIKRGAVLVLMAAAAEGKIETRLVPLLAKHQDPQHAFPTTTCR